MKERYFHGGNRNLHVNDYLLPPATTGAEVMGGWNNANYRNDRVYLTVNREDAQTYASASPAPVVYEAIPKEIEPDPDFPTSDSIACMKARIIAIHKIPGKVIKKNKKALLKRAHQLEAARRQS
jgi:hypothetical protein